MCFIQIFCMWRFVFLSRNNVFMWSTLCYFINIEYRFDLMRWHGVEDVRQLGLKSRMRCASYLRYVCPSVLLVCACRTSESLRWTVEDIVADLCAPLAAERPAESTAMLKIDCRHTSIKSARKCLTSDHCGSTKERLSERKFHPILFFYFWVT